MSLGGGFVGLGPLVHREVLLLLYYYYYYFFYLCQSLALEKKALPTTHKRNRKVFFFLLFLSLECRTSTRVLYYSLLQLLELERV